MTHVQKNNLKLSLLKELIGTITATESIDSITNLVLDLGIDYTTARRGSVLLIDEKGYLVIKAAKGINPDELPSVRIKIGEGICGKVVQNKTPALVKDMHADKHPGKDGDGTYKTSSYISCPVQMQGDVLGVINVADKENGDPFTEDELEMIEILAAQTATALSYAQIAAELRTMLSELDERNRVLIDSDRLRSEFAAIMSHEFRTPLNSIAGAAYYLKEKKVTPSERKEFVHIISSEIKKLINLLDDILDFSLIEKEKPLLKKKILDLKDIFQELAASKTVKEILAKNNITLKIACPGSCPYIVGEKVRLIQAFIHLIEGIGRCTSAGDSIRLTAVRKNTSVHIRLSVKEKNIPETELPLLFDSRAPWTDINDIKNKLKLYLAKKTVELHKGSVSAFNTSDGISFQLIFPLDMKERHDARLDELTNLLLALTAEAMDLNKCSLMLTDELTGELVIKNAIGFDEDIIRRTRIRAGDEIAGRVAAENKPLLIEDIESHPGFSRKSLSRYTTKSLLCLPIRAHNKVIGVLNLNNKANGQPFDRKDLYFASALTERYSHIIEKIQRQDVTDSEFKTAAKNLEALIHAERLNRKKDGTLSMLVVKLMQQLQRSEDEIKHAVYAAAFYDLGLTQVDEHILMKTGALSSVEKKIIRTHPFPSAGMISYLETGDTVTKTILYHHERYDGSGYPHGLRGDNIPFLSRVLSMVDAYTAMTASRPYRKALSTREAAEAITNEAGKQFDPQIVEAFTKII
ncbi:MAG: GAF domain-containing protein [Nitrospiraceae bacterium]|nr:MAG: GAF domain-containing protein [Nitrospiraceae bacterium]